MDSTGILLFAGIFLSVGCVFAAKQFFPADAALIQMMAALMGGFAGAFWKHLPGGAFVKRVPGPVSDTKPPAAPEVKPPASPESGKVA